MEREDLRSSTDSTISTSLIHCIASVANCEQVHASILNLIFPISKCCWVGEFVKMKIRNLQSLLVCPIILCKFPSLGSNEFLAAGPGWHLGSKIVSGDTLESTERTLADKVLKKTPLELQKRFVIYHAYSKCLAAHHSGSAFPWNGSAFRQDLEKVGITQVDLERGIVHCVLIQHL